ncbi:hypothetical protein [Caballeronia sp. KNU42]
MIVTEATFEGRYRSRDQHLANVQGTALGVLKLVQRAREGEEADANISCAAYWLESAAAELRALLKERRK